MRNASGRTEWKVRDFFTRPRGWIYVDVMIAVVVLLICVGAIMASYRQMTLEGMFSRSYQEATFHAKSIIEEEHFRESQNEDGLSTSDIDYMLTVPYIRTSIDGKREYMFHWEPFKLVQDVPNLREATLAGSWQDEGSKKPVTIRVSTYFRVIVP